MNWRLQPADFAREWADAWNRRDVEAVLVHFDDDVMFSSPIARQIGFCDDGIVRGKEALRRYWLAALRVNDKLTFEVVAVHRGVDVLTITYTNLGRSRVEVLCFRGEKVVEGHGLLGTD